MIANPATASALRYLEEAQVAVNDARRMMESEAKAAQAMREILLTYWIDFHAIKDYTTCDTLRRILEAGGYRIAGGHKDAKDGRADYYLQRIIGG